MCRNIWIFPPISTIFLKLFTLCVANAGTGSKHRQLKCKPVILLSFRPTSNIFVFSLPKSRSVNIKIRKSTFDRVFINLLQNKTVLSDYFAQTLYSQIIKTP